MYLHVVVFRQYNSLEKRPLLAIVQEGQSKQVVTSYEKRITFTTVNGKLRLKIEETMATQFFSSMTADYKRTGESITARDHTVFTKYKQTSHPWFR